MGGGQGDGALAAFATLVENCLSYRQTTGRYGLISSNYDTELFGHWWFEGVTWLAGVGIWRRVMLWICSDQ